MKTILKTTFLGIALAVTAGSAMAAETQTSNETTMKVTVKIPPLVSITQPDDIQLNFDGQSDMEATSAFCIATNSSTPVKLLITSTDAASTGSQPGNSFALTSENGQQGKGNSIPFDVYYLATFGGYDSPIKSPRTNSTQAVYGQTLDAQGIQWLNTCDTDSKAGSALQVRVNKDNAKRVYADTYTTTLKLVVTPE